MKWDDDAAEQQRCDDQFAAVVFVSHIKTAERRGEKADRGQQEEDLHRTSKECGAAGSEAAYKGLGSA
jgi:hypothetical protein